MTKQTINIGRSANDKTGDPIRVAFRKVNQNFDEIYAGGLGGGNPFNQSLNTTNNVTFNSVGTATVNVSQINGTNPGNELVIQSNNNNWTFDGNGTLRFPESRLSIDSNGAIIASNNNNVVLESSGQEGAAGMLWFSQEGQAPNAAAVFVNGGPFNSPGSVSIGTGKILGEPFMSNIWTFDNAGTLTVPSPTQDSFRIRLSSENFVPRQGKTSLTLTGTAWDFYGAFVHSQDGQTQLAADNGPLPSLTNPGYEDGDTFAIDVTAHGIPGYVLTVELSNVVQAGPAGWTASLAFSEPPAYPSTVKSLGAIKVTSNENSWIFGTDGKLTIPGKIKHNNTLLDLNDSNSGNAYLTTTDDDSTALFMNVNGIQTYARQSVSLLAGTALGALQNTYDEQLVILNDTWQSVSDNAGYPWGITQPLSQNTYVELTELEPGVIGQGEQNLVLVAYNVRNAWTEWQNALENTSVSIAASNKTWTFGADGTTKFPTNTINPGNNQSLKLRTQSTGGSAYAEAYQTSNSWEAYAEDDDTGAHNAYAWIKADLVTANTPRVFITNAKSSDGTELTWTFDAVGNLTLPAGGDIVDSNGDTVLGSGSNSYTPNDANNWLGSPTVNTISAALDELAARLTAFENFEIDGGNANTPTAGELLIDGNGA